MSVSYTNAVLDYLNELVQALYNKKYFGFIDSAEAYVFRITNEIETTIHTKQHKPTPLPLLRYGKFYIKITYNKKTTWYVFFDKKDNRYFVEHITNNHAPHSEIIKGL